MSSRRNLLLKSFGDALAKIGCVIFGWWVMQGLSKTLTYVLLDSPVVVEKEHLYHVHEQPEVSPTLTATIMCAVFFFSLLLSAFVSLGSSYLPARPEELILGGCSLIPAWAWKSFVDDTIIAMNLSGPILDAIFLVAITFTAAVLDVGSEVLMRRLEKDSFFFNALKPMSTSFILGVAFAVNNVFYACMPILVDDTVPSQRLMVNCVYLVGLTLFIWFMMRPMRNYLTFRSEQDGLPTPFNLGILFVFKSDVFILAWACQGVADAVLAMDNSSAFANAVIISCFNLVVITLLVLLNFHGLFLDFVENAVALNVAWAWMTVCANSMGDVVQLSSLWMIGVGEAVCALAFAGIAEFVLYKLQSPEEEEEAKPLISGAGQTARPQCAGGILKLCQRSPQGTVSSKQNAL